MSEIPYGYCHCGCGEKPNLSDRTESARGYIKGEPYRFVAGHNSTSGSRDYVITPFGCWEWQRCVDVNGYGRLRRKGSTSGLAHRWYYEQHRGIVPKGRHLDHLCRNPRCVNPYHLEAVSHTVNVRRGRGAKLTWDAVQAIRSSAESAPKIAPRFGVSVYTIRNVRAGRLWAEECPA